MNRRQKKKAFKKRFGFNPPHGISIRTATRIMERKEYMIATFERLKAAILNLWEWVKKPALELAEELKKIGLAFISVQERNRQQREALTDFQTKVMLQQRQQESEVKRIEGNSDIHNYDRRQGDRADEAFRH